MEIDSTLILYAGMAVLLVLTVAALVVAVKAQARANQLSDRLTRLMRDGDGKSIEHMLVSGMDDIFEIREMEDSIRRDLSSLYSMQNNCFQKRGFVQYNAYEENGGNLSFALTLLDKKNNGFILNIMHTTAGSFTYAKEVKDGRCRVDISEEEQRSLEQALSGGNSESRRTEETKRNKTQLKEARTRE